jgi:hypothetical protein
MFAALIFADAEPYYGYWFPAAIAIGHGGTE